MSQAPTPSSTPPGMMNRPVMNPNNVHKLIKAHQAAKATGLFTFQAGRTDRILNLGIGLGMCFILANVGHGAYQLAHGVGRKEGF